MTDNMAIMTIDPTVAIQAAKARYQTLIELKNNLLVENLDYGKIPNTDKPTLLKAGAEKLCSTFGLNPKFEILDKIEIFSDEGGLFHYNVMCHLIHIATGLEIATGIGSCNSKEKQHRWRWVRGDEVPSYLDKSKLVKRNGMITEPEFAIDKAETMGKYGKPTEYWAAFEQAMTDGTAIKGSREKKGGGGTYVTWSIGGDEYRIPNDEVFTLANTIQKMACKRALVAATLIGTNASEFFTQDMEDLYDYSSEFVVGKAAPALPAQKKEAEQPSSEKIIVDDEVAKMKAEAIAAERDTIMADMVGEGKVFPTANDLKDLITMLGYKGYAEMREKLSYEEVVKALSPVKTEPILSSEAESVAPATNGKSKAKA